jgi:hypothetical protein
MKRLLLLAMLSILLLGTVKAQSIAGVYDSDFNEMTLQVNGNKVTGTYKWADGRIEGTLSGHTLKGRWTQSNGKGRFVFEFNSDFSAFTGKWSYNDAEPASKWNGKKKGATITTAAIAGVYDSDFNEMTLQVNGNKVTGTYKWADGHIEGTLSGHTLTGRWTQSNGKGRFVFEFNSDFSAFTGKWSYNDAEPASKWNGKKK